MRGRLIAALAAAALVSACADAWEQKNIDLAGAPSPSVAMYASQIRFAGSVCDTADSKAAEDFARGTLEVGLQAGFYEKHYDRFAQSAAQSLQRYGAHWRGMDQTGRARFCEGYRRDVMATQQTFGLSRAQVRAGKLKAFFSPPSQPTAERQTQATLVLAVLAAATIAGSVAQVDNGNFDGAARLNDATGAITGAMTSPNVVAAACPAYSAFTRHDAGAGDPVWGSYVSIASCP